MNAAPRLPLDTEALIQPVPALSGFASFFASIFASIFVLVVVAVGTLHAFEIDTDRPGADYRNVPVRGSAQVCQRLCEDDPSCRAWTFVREGLQGPQPRCWLKRDVPPRRASSCCVSGVVSRDTSQDGRERLDDIERNANK
jgi:hypothetical protein